LRSKWAAGPAMAGRAEGAYLDRYVTDPAKAGQPPAHFYRHPPGRGQLAVFTRCSLLTYQSRYARRHARNATRSVAGGSRLEKQPTDRRRKPCYLWDRTLAQPADCKLSWRQDEPMNSLDTSYTEALLKDQDAWARPDLDWVKAIAVNKSAVERRVATLAGRRTVKKEWQAAWLLKAITCIDLTTLSGDDTEGKVQRLCAKAKSPVRAELLEALGVSDITVGAVCVYPTMVAHAVRALSGTNIPVASVAAGFPTGLMPMTQRLEEIRYAVDQGAAEIDIVITRELVLTGRWEELFDEVAACKDACGRAHLKVILATGELATLRNVARASMVAQLAGADFIKTSTGKEAVNATLPVTLTMVRCIRNYYEATGRKVGFKPAGGIRSAKDALAWQILMKEELGRDWLEPELFRIGASGLLTDIERQLEYFVTGRYSAGYRHPAA
jgi:deoxyribose-phosphate aldolase